MRNGPLSKKSGGIQGAGVYFLSLAVGIAVVIVDELSRR